MDASVLGLLLPTSATAAAIALFYRRAPPPPPNTMTADNNKNKETEEEKNYKTADNNKNNKTEEEKSYKTADNNKNNETGGEQPALVERSSDLIADLIAEWARGLGTAEEANLKEVRAEDMIKGKNYYIEMVGRYNNEHRQSGKAIGISFTKTITYEEIEEQLNSNEFARIEFGGLGPEYFNDHRNQKFVVFDSVVPVNRGVRECGICMYRYFPPIPDNWKKYKEDEINVSRGGYKFFEKIEKENIIKEKIVGKIVGKKLPDDVIPIIGNFMGGKKRKSKRKKSKKLKRKKKNKTEKNKTKKSKIVICGFVK